MNECLVNGEISTLVPALNSCFLVGKTSQIVVLAIAGLVSLRLVLETAPLAAAGVSITTGLVFGLLPAMRAA